MEITSATPFTTTTEVFLSDSYLKTITGVVDTCSRMFNFDAAEAMSRMGVVIRSRRPRGGRRAEARRRPVKNGGAATGGAAAAAAAAKKPSIPLPFLGIVSDTCCQSLRPNHGLFTQCSQPRPAGDSPFCQTCRSKCEASGVAPNTAQLRKRAFDANEVFVTSLGKKPTPYATVMKRLKITREQAIEEAASLSMEIDPVHFEEVPAKKSTRVYKRKEKVVAVAPEVVPAVLTAPAQLADVVLTAPMLIADPAQLADVVLAAPVVLAEVPTNDFPSQINGDSFVEGSQAMECDLHQNDALIEAFSEDIHFPKPSAFEGEFGEYSATEERMLEEIGLHQEQEQMREAESDAAESSDVEDEDEEEEEEEDDASDASEELFVPKKNRSVKEAKVPKVKVPKEPKVPKVKVPKEPKVPKVKVPKEPKVPKVKIPKEAKVPKVKVPKEAKVPKVKIPKEPKVKKIPKGKNVKAIDTDNDETDLFSALVKRAKESNSPMTCSENEPIVQMKRSAKKQAKKEPIEPILFGTSSQDSSCSEEILFDYPKKPAAVALNIKSPGKPFSFAADNGNSDFEGTQ